MAHDAETRDRAEDLFVVDGLTLKDVAREVEVPERTVEQWSSEGNWTEKRREHRSTIADIKRKSVMLKRQLISKALLSLEGKEKIDSQDMHGFRSILAAAEIKEKQTAEAHVDRPRLFLEDMEFIAEVLKEIDPEGLKVLARSFETIVERFKRKVESKEHSA